jgi:hypothetical protein
MNGVLFHDGVDLDLGRLLVLLLIGVLRVLLGGSSR